MKVDYMATGKRNLSHSPPAPDSDTIQIPLLTATTSMRSVCNVAADEVMMGDLPFEPAALHQHFAQNTLKGATFDPCI